MSYSKQVKQRAIELSKICSSAANVLKALEKEFPTDQIPTDERTIRRWFQKENICYLTNVPEHFAQLADIVNLILANDVGKILIVTGEADTPERIYDIVSEDSGFTEITHRKLTGRIECNIDYVCQHYSTWHMWDCFAAHLEAEYPESRDFYKFISTHTSILINALRTMAERKAFKGTCPVCQSLNT